METESTEEGSTREVVEETEYAYYYLTCEEHIENLKEQAAEFIESGMTGADLGLTKKYRKIEMTESLKTYDLDGEEVGYTKADIIIYANFGDEVTYLVSPDEEEAFFVKTEELEKVMIDMGEVEFP